MGIQAFLPEAAVERPDLGVIRGFSRSGEVQLDPMLVGPFVHSLRDEFVTVVDLDRPGKPTGHPKLLEHTHHIFSLQALPDIDGQAFAGVVINDGQRPQPATIEQGIGDKIHAPDVVDPC